MSIPPDLVSQWRRRFQEGCRDAQRAPSGTPDRGERSLKLYRFLLSSYASEPATPEESHSTEEAADDQPRGGPRQPALLAAPLVGAPPKSLERIRATLKSVHAANSEARAPLLAWLRHNHRGEEWVVVADSADGWALDLCWELLRRAGIKARKSRQASRIVLETGMGDCLDASRLLRLNRQELRVDDAPLWRARGVQRGLAAIQGGMLGGALMLIGVLARSLLLVDAPAPTALEAAAAIGLAWMLGATIGMALACCRDARHAAPEPARAASI